MTISPRRQSARAEWVQLQVRERINVYNDAVDGRKPATGYIRRRQPPCATNLRSQAHRTAAFVWLLLPSTLHCKDVGAAFFQLIWRVNLVHTGHLVITSTPRNLIYFALEIFFRHKAE